MVIDMSETQLKTVAQLRAFQRHTGCTVPVHRRRYEALRVHRGGSQAPVPPRLGRTDKGVVLRYLERLAGYSRQQVKGWCAVRSTGKRWSSAIRYPSTSPRLLRKRMRKTCVLHHHVEAALLAHDSGDGRNGMLTDGGVYYSERSEVEQAMRIGFDFVTISPVYETRSHPAAPSLG
jgi:hypothetical protein